MKKRYVKPELMAEDFSVSEMVAANCGIAAGDEWGPNSSKGNAYAIFSDLYEGEKDVDGNPLNGYEFCFTKAYADQSGTDYICSYIPAQKFGNGFWDCTDDSTLIQNS